MPFGSEASSHTSASSSQYHAVNSTTHDLTTLSLHNSTLSQISYRVSSVNGNGRPSGDGRQQSSSINGGEGMGDDEEDTRLESGARYIVTDNLKIFNAAVHTLSRFSDNLHFEPTPNGLALKVLTASHSAFASIHFHQEFFGHADTATINPDEYNICRVSMRCALANFNAFAKEPLPLSSEIQVDPQADVMMVRTRYPAHVSKSAVINLRECAATYRHLFSDKERLENVIRVSPSVLLTVLPQIGSSDADELRIFATPAKLLLERHIREATERRHVRKTLAEVNLASLDLYSIAKEADVCLRVKEFKAILHFADQCGLSVSIHFDSPSKPVIVALEENVDFTAEFTLGTFGHAPSTALPLPLHEMERLVELSSSTDPLAASIATADVIAGHPLIHSPVGSMDEFLDEGRNGIEPSKNNDSWRDEEPIDQRLATILEEATRERSSVFEYPAPAPPTDEGGRYHSWRWAGGALYGDAWGSGGGMRDEDNSNHGAGSTQAEFKWRADRNGNHDDAMNDSFYEDY